MSQKNKPEPAVAAAPKTDALGFAARVLVGALLIYTGALKAAQPAEEFSVVIEMYNILPPDMALTAATFLPWVEMLVGWALLLGWFTQAAASAAIGMFMTFVLALASTKLRGIPITNCGCFGGAFHPSPMTTLVVDLCLSALAFLALKRGPGGPSLDTWADRAHN